MTLTPIHPVSAPPIHVSVRAEFIPEQSNLETERFVFAYHVTIENRGDTAAQLISRHWIITDGNQRIQEVRGDGVIGEQPTISPGESYAYSSGTVIQTPVGSMHGSYQMRDTNGTLFSAEIPTFTLARPGALH